MKPDVARCSLALLAWFVAIIWPMFASNGFARVAAPMIAAFIGLTLWGALDRSSQRLRFL